MSCTSQNNVDRAGEEVLTLDLFEFYVGGSVCELVRSPFARYTFSKLTDLHQPSLEHPAFVSASNCVYTAQNLMLSSEEIG